MGYCLRVTDFWSGSVSNLRRMIADCCATSNPIDALPSLAELLYCTHVQYRTADRTMRELSLLGDPLLPLPNRPLLSRLYLLSRCFVDGAARLGLLFLRAGAGRGLSGAWSVCGVDSMRRRTSSGDGAVRLFMGGVCHG